MNHQSSANRGRLRAAFCCACPHRELAGQGCHTYINRNSGEEGILGSFSDAFKSGQQAKQTGIDRARQKESDQTQNAQAWVTNVLAPVVTEAANDVAADGKIVMRDNSDSPKIESEVTIAMNGKPPTRLTFIADENGAIKFYRDRSQGNTLGTIATVSQVQVRQLFIQTLAAIGRS